MWAAIALQQELAKKFMAKEKPHPRVLNIGQSANNSQQNSQLDDFDAPYKPKLSLAQKLGLVKPPDAPLNKNGVQWKRRQNNEMHLQSLVQFVLNFWERMIT